MNTAQLSKGQLLELLVKQEQMLAEQERLLEKQERLLDKKEELITHQKERIEALENQIRYWVNKQYGTQSEKLSDDQLSLFDSESESAPEPKEDDDKITVSYERKRRGKRKNLDESLERHVIEYELTEADRVCECGGCLEPVSSKTSEQYEYIPAQVIVIRHVEHQYACPCCEKMVLAKKPPQPLPKTNAAAGLLAYLVTTKYVDGVPLYRQEKQMERLGIHLPRNSMSRWVIQLGELVLPLINLLEDCIRAGPAIQCDETSFQVLKEIGRKATQLSYIWVRRGGAPGRHVVLYHYSPSRSSQVALELMSGYEGYVQCDGYSGYAILESHNMVLVGCMAHCRRKFNDVLKSTSKKETRQRTKAAIALRFFKRLYDIETKGKTLTDDERYALRQTHAVPILEEFKQWLDDEIEGVLPKSPLGKAMNYALNQWPKLIRYCDAGYLEIDNNSDERAIRPLAIGRKNYLFSDTAEGAQANARLYSLIETCKLHGHEPYAYLKHIFKELPKATSIEQYEALLPWNLDVESLKEMARFV